MCYTIITANKTGGTNHAKQNHLALKPCLFPSMDHDHRHGQTRIPQQKPGARRIDKYVVNIKSAACSPPRKPDGHRHPEPQRKAEDMKR